MVFWCCGNCGNNTTSNMDEETVHVNNRLKKQAKSPNKVRKIYPNLNSQESTVKHKQALFQATGMVKSYVDLSDMNESDASQSEKMDIGAAAGAQMGINLG